MTNPRCVSCLEADTFAPAPPLLPVCLTALFFATFGFLFDISVAYFLSQLFGIATPTLLSPTSTADHCLCLPHGMLGNCDCFPACWESLPVQNINLHHLAASSCLSLEMICSCSIGSSLFFYSLFGVGGAVRFLVVGTIGQRERPPRGQLWMEQCLTPLKYWPI